VTEDTRSGEAQAQVSGADIRTFLFADMRGYTRFTQEHGDDAASALAGRFADLVREVVPEFDGELLELRGDEALCVFRSARQALRASVDLQRRLRTATATEPAFPIGVGMGLDAGEAVPTQGAYRGASLNLAARLCALAKPGEVLATDNVAHFAQRIDGLRLLEGHSANLKGLARPVRYVKVAPEQPLPQLPLPDATSGGGRRWLYIAGLAVVALVGIGIVVRLQSTSTRRAASVSQIPGTGILRVDAASGALRVSALPSGPGAVYDAAYGLGSLWVTTPKGLLKVDPGTGRVVRSLPMTDGGGSIAFGRSTVYVTGLLSGANNVELVNPDTDTVMSEITTQPYTGGQSEFYVLDAFGSLWVWGSGRPGCCQGRMFWRIDPASGNHVARWPSPNDNGSYTGLFNQVTTGSRSVWMLRQGRLWRIDPTTNELSGGLKVDASMITAQAGAIWAVDRLGSVSEINPAFYPGPGAIIWTHHFSNMLADNVAAGDGQIWLLDGSNQRLTRINATSRHIIQTPLPIYGGGVPTVSRDAAWIGYPQGYGQTVLRATPNTQ
jgi:class 3 adenylate cyclase